MIRLYPLAVFELIGDLSVDTGSWFRALAERVEGWVHERARFDENAREQCMDDDVARAIYELDRCIECGCCIAACGVADVNEDFAGPAWLDRIARFMPDPRDCRETADWFEIVANEDGIFKCLGTMACHDVCPKELPLLEVHAFLHRKMLLGSLGIGKGGRSK